MRIAVWLCTVSILGWLAGCASPPQKTLAELDTLLAHSKAASVRLYPGKTASDVRQAAHQVLYLLDPDDMEFDVQGDSLLATRWSTFYAVFYLGFGRNWYSVDLEETKDGTIARFGFTSTMTSGLFPSPIPASFKPNIPVSAHQNPADFILFHNRIEFLLGLRAEWDTCKKAKQGLGSKNDTLFLCDNIGLVNAAPNQPAPTVVDGK